MRYQDAFTLKFAVSGGPADGQQFVIFKRAPARLLWRLRRGSRGHFCDRLRCVPVA